MKRFFLTLPATICLLSTLAVAQSSHHFPTPPPSMDPDNAQTPTSDSQIKLRVDYTKLQKDADDLARQAQSIQSEVASVRQGMLPKDVLEKLKQVEKLSKRLRTELNP